MNVLAYGSLRMRLEISAFWRVALLGLVGILTPWAARTACGGMNVSSAPGYIITWTGTEGAHLNGPVPDNIALSANGSTAFAESQYGSPHFTTHLNNGTYGNNNGWLRNIGVAYPGVPAESWFGIDLPGTDLYDLTQVAWGRDNVTGPYSDRWQALYTLQFTTDTSVHTGNGGTWTTIGTVEYPDATGYSPWLRHAFTISTGGGDPITATGFRVLIDNYNDGSQVIIDEFEIEGSLDAALTVVNNAGGAIEITTTGAKIRGQLVSEAAAPTTCRFEWWENGSATTNTVLMGTRTPGDIFTNALSGLTPATLHYYRTTASNSVEVVAATPASFTTLTPLTVQHEYLFDEGVAGNQINPTTPDTVGSSTLTRSTGDPRFSATVPSGGTASTLSADFANVARLDTANPFLWGTATDNFGMEAWIRPGSVAGNQSILVNGYSSGVQGIYQVGGEYHMMLDGTLYDVNAAITGIGTWDHVAMVRDQGVATLYVNGVAAGSTAAAVSGTPNAHAFVGAASPGYTSNGGNFVGMVDTIRYFTFTGGTFDVDDLDAPPVLLASVNNAGGAIDITTTGAKIRGQLVSEAAAPTTCRFEWWEDGSATINTVLMGTRTPGDIFTNALSGLTPATLHYYRTAASNSVEVVAATPASFTTLTPFTVQNEYLFEDPTKSAGNALGSNVGDPNNRVTDTVGTKHMQAEGGPGVYSTTVPSSGTASTLSADFTGAGGHVVAVPGGTYWGSATDNFGVEGWVRPESITGTRPLFVNGYNYMAGVYQVDDEFKIVLYTAGGNTFYDFNASVSLNTWTHLALVRDNGTASLYVNGVSVGSTTDAITQAPNLHSWIGGRDGGAGGGFAGAFDGQIDTVRYFTFSGGAFDAGDLDYTAPALTSVNNAGGAIEITTTGAKIRGQLVTEAAAPTTCRFEWWENGSATTNTVLMGTRTPGDIFTNALSGLTPATLHYYRTTASNSVEVVAAAPASFTTLTPFTVQHEYLFEEGVAGNQISSPTPDTVGSSPMTRGGDPRYSATVPRGGTVDTTSTRSADFANQGRLDTANGALWGTETDNFGMEAWVRPGSIAGNQSILVNGYSSGVQGIYQVGGEYQMMLDGTLYDFNAAITGIGTWDHVAMVRDQGVATLYVNGVAVGSTPAIVSGIPNAHSFIGAASPGYTSGGGDFLGMVDTVRFFTFSGGTFDVTNLDFTPLPPQSVFSFQ